jgi:hypothetical protein
MEKGRRSLAMVRPRQYEDACNRLWRQRAHGWSAWLIQVPHICSPRDVWVENELEQALRPLDLGLHGLGAAFNTSWFAFERRYAHMRRRPT